MHADDAERRLGLVLVEQPQGLGAYGGAGKLDAGIARDAFGPLVAEHGEVGGGFLVVGVSSRLRFDDAYKVFLDLASAQIATAIANARSLEMERRRNAALAEIDRAKTTFFSNISHEFRTPLASITSIAGILLADMDGPLTSEQRRQVQYVQGSVRELTEMVDGLLDLAEGEAGRVSIAPE